MDKGSLVIEQLTLEELPQRETLTARYRIGRGEAACLVLAQRYRAAGIFLSSDEWACLVAQDLGIEYFTVRDLVEQWVRQVRLALVELDALLSGMRAARFGLTEEFERELKSKCGS